MDKRRHKNIDLPRHVTKTTKGLYKYNRRVPLHLRERIGRAAWDYSLGTDPTAAARKALDLAAQHDRLISGLTGGETAGPAGEWLDTLKNLTDLLSRLKGEGSTDAWEQTRSYMRAAREQHPTNEADRLKALAALVFGEKVAPLSDPFGTGQTLRFDPPPPALIPEDATDCAMFEATKGAVTTRLAELEATPADSSPLRLSVLLAAYLDARAVRANTRASYRVKTDRLIAFAGEVPAPETTANSPFTFNKPGTLSGRSFLKRDIESPLKFFQNFSARNFTFPETPPRPRPRTILKPFMGHTCTIHEESRISVTN